MASSLALLDAVRSRVTRWLERVSLQSRVRMLSSSMLTGLVFVACSVLTGPPDLSAADGVYRLERVDGVALPIAIEAGDCPREISTGSLSLDPTVARRRPLFSVSVVLRLQCNPTRVLPVGMDELVRDFGKWTIIGDAVQLRSDQGYGNQLVPILDPEPGTPGPILTVERGGKRYTFRRTRRYGVPPG